jgi:NAD(P)-dependent dehydrogenase (short-subunit alcohol dehydrogenase family)
VAAGAQVLSLTKSIAFEWIKYGIRCVAVSPGVVYSDSAFAHYGPAADSFLAALLPAIPARRLGSVEEVSAAVTFLLSPAAAYITGVDLAVDGGSALVAKPLVDIPDKAHLPVFGTLPPRAKL